VQRDGAGRGDPEEIARSILTAVAVP
jgi:hypothetical protein